MDANKFFKFRFDVDDLPRLRLNVTFSSDGGLFRPFSPWCVGCANPEEEEEEELS